MAAVLFLYWLGFGSIIIPVRAIATMGFSLAWVFGLAVLVYQHGALKFMDFAPLSPTQPSTAGAKPELCWLIPVMAFSIMVGLSLDYDVFLVSRIVEFRLEGKSDRESVLLGLAKTGRIITGPFGPYPIVSLSLSLRSIILFVSCFLYRLTDSACGMCAAAGIIMAIAFFGLLLSNQASMNQLSFFLVIAVLFDTFIVSTILVPACMSIIGSGNWWPLVVPAVEAPTGQDGTPMSSPGLAHGGSGYMRSGGVTHATPSLQ